MPNNNSSYSSSLYRPFTVFTGIRYTASRRNSKLVSFISLLSISGLALGVGLLILVLSVMNGFGQELQERILGVAPHASLYHYDDIENWQSLIQTAESHPKVTAASPYVQLQGMLTVGTNVLPTAAYGILPQREAQASVISQHMVQGALEELTADGQGCILGANIAKQLGITVGDTVSFIMPKSMLNEDTGTQRIIPKLAFLQVKGIFKTGTEVDASLILIHMNAAQMLAEIDNRVHGVKLQVDDLFRASAIGYELLRELPQGYYVRDWTRSHGNLFNAIQLSKNLVGLLLFIIIAVAAFNVVSTLIMVVNDKQGDIAILRTLGASTFNIMTIFVVQGTLIGVLGATIGALVGCGLSLVITDFVSWLEIVIDYQFLKADVYPISYLPSHLRWQDVLWVAGVALGMSFVATLYPSWRAARVQPAVALGYE